MTYSLGSRRWRFVSLGAVALMLVSASSAAQTPPPDQPPVPTPPPEPAQPAPPPPAPPTPTAGIPEPTPIYPQMKGREITLGEGTWIRFGLQSQTWLDILQSSFRKANGDDGDYAFNLYERRLRLFAGVQAFRRLQIFVLIEGSNLGRASSVLTAAGATAETKNFNSIALLDGWAEIQLHEFFYLEAGMMLVPLSRNGLQATTTYLSLDVGATSATILGIGTSVLRDVGIMAKGYLLDDHLEYRLGVFAGARDLPTADNIGSKNAPRVAGFLQYNLLDVDKGYVFQGTYYGRKQIAGIASGFDFQKGTGADPYWAASANVFAAIPLDGNPKEGGDEVAGFAQYLHLDGSETVAAAALQAQNDLLVEAAYYNRDTKLSVFGKFEGRFYAAEATKVLNQLWFGGGVKYHLYDNGCNFTLRYERSSYPNAPTTGTGARNSTNQITFAIQALYY
ncbi:MAG TPA: hypothetical protein VKE22_02255 [Haliangiales bacterium]|nr:hypothetical protein [Haliangiales bacterium]